MPETDRPLRVFLCHASQDKPAVRELYQRLKSEGWIDPWLDEEKLSFGQHWTTVIEDALQGSDIVLIFLSRNSVYKEGFVQRELNYAWELSLEKPRHVIFLIPFRLDDCEIPRYLGSRQWGDYFGEKKENTYQILLRSLKQRHTQKLQLEAEESSRHIAEEVKRRQAEEDDRKAKEKRAPREAKMNARRQAEEKARLAAEELMHKRVEEEVQKDNEALAKKTEEKRARREAEELAQRQKEEKKALQEAEEQARAYREKAARLESEEQARQAAEVRKREEADEMKRKRAIIEQVRKQTDVVTPPRAQAAKRWEEMTRPDASQKTAPKNNRTFYITGGLLLLLFLCGVFGINSLIQNLSSNDTPTPTRTVMIGITMPDSTPTNTLIPISPTPELGVDSTMISEKDGMTLLYVPASEFTMGSEIGDTDEKPVHKVFLEAFWIDQTEVTIAMYVKCEDDNGYRELNHWYFSDPEYENYPVVAIPWTYAIDYCSWANRRLPSEAEWEKAASWNELNQQKTIYPWGNIIDIDCTFANYGVGKCNTWGPVSIGMYLKGKSPYGAHDMAGNVWEWVSSLYKPYPYNMTDGREDLSSNDRRVLRGGSWNNEDHDVRATTRRNFIKSSAFSNIGFRCAVFASE